MKTCVLLLVIAHLPGKRARALEGKIFAQLADELYEDALKALPLGLGRLLK